MGNSNSSHREPPPSHSWTLSYPRPHQKVLPDRYPGQRLRVTNNGVLLQTAGTLNRHAYGYPVPVARFGSEPDLRFTGREFMSYAPPPPHHTTESPSKQRISRSRKKYKAPTPVTNGVDSSSPESYQAWDTSAENSEVHAPPLRKSRLFKTHAESKGPHPPRLSKIPPLHRSLSSPQFHEELLEATQKLRRQQRHRSKSPSALENHVNNHSSQINGIHSNQINENHSNQMNGIHSNQINGNHSNQMNGTHSNQINGNHSNQMNGTHSNQIHGNHSNQMNGIHNNQIHGNHSNQMNGNHSNHIVDSTKPAQAPPRQNRGAKEKQITPNIRSDLYSSNKENVLSSANHQNQSEMREIVKEEIVKSNWDNIKPVKTFYFGMQEDDIDHINSSNNEAEMDRFAASIHRHSPISDSVEEEADINNISLHLRPTLPRKQLDIPRFSPTAAWRLLASLESPPLSHNSGGEEDDLVVPHVTDKSIDSGISGDASPQMFSTHDSNTQAAWTPQQDLEETSSDGGLESSPVTPDTMPAPTFSLSLPRDVNNAKHSFTMLQPNGWLEQGSREGREGGGSSLVDENWVLSRSVPSSLHLQRWHTGGDQSHGDVDLLGQSLPYGGRVMYLPEYQPSRTPHSMQDMTPFSKSLDNLLLSSHLTEEPPQSGDIDLDSPHTESLAMPLKRKKNKKFTFQSTVRQIERRRIAEKLSKEAQQKERQRLMELDTMQRVEAEFQRKREREKADIRQQLRLYTHVLSEYKQPSRDYKDYTPNITRTERSEAPDTPPSQVIHPQVVYQMPKNTQVYVVANGGPSNNTPSTLSDNSNYRRDFAQGVMPRSGSELSQPISHRSSSQPDLSNDASSDPESPVQDNKPEIDTAVPEPKLTPMLPTSPPLKTSAILTSLLQPFDRNKSYRPIAFTPNPTTTQIAG